MRSRPWIWMMLAAALALASGCKGESATGGPTGTGKPAGGCDRREKEWLCGEYYGMAKPDWVKKECPLYGEGPYVERCPTEGAVGRCVNEAGTVMETHTIYYARWTKEQVKGMCKAPMQLREP